jgi:hypothetical protein
MRGRRRVKNALRIWQHRYSKVFRSTIDNQNLARNEAGRVAEQEDRRVSDVPGISLAAHGKRPTVLSGGALRRKAILTLCPSNRARCDDIGTYTMGTFFYGKDSRCRIYCSFRGRDMYLIRRT